MSSYAPWSDISVPFRSFGPLVTPDALLQYNAHEDASTGVGAYTPQVRAILRTYATYIQDFLTQPHPDLGRTGPVCPFVPAALPRHLLRVTACASSAPVPQTLTLEIFQILAAFEHIKATEALGATEIYRAFVMVFPHLLLDASVALIEQIHTDLKPAFTVRGLMFGEFYPTCASPGLHNPEFRPLQAPVASLVIRQMTIFDAPFLMHEARYRQHFSQKFGQVGEKKMRACMQKAHLL